MKVFLATANNKSWSKINYAEITVIARSDKHGAHKIVDSPDEADLLFFTDFAQLLEDWTMNTLRSNTWARKFPEKIFVYDERDVPRELFPGVFVSMPKSRHNPQRQRAISYFQQINTPDFYDFDKVDLLFSFQGRRAGDIRNKILDLHHPCALIEDTSHVNFFGGSGQELEERRHIYRETLGRSKFVLCPRGAGSASFRLFETLAAGRVPVIISDEYVLPSGIDWDNCSVRIKESEIETLPAQLENLEADFTKMAMEARHVYVKNFASDAWFHYAMEQCAHLKAEGAAGSKKFFWFDTCLARDGLRILKRKIVK